MNDKQQVCIIEKEGIIFILPIELIDEFDQWDGDGFDDKFWKFATNRPLEEYKLYIDKDA